MLDQNRLRLMTKMAAYESTKGQEDLKISTYYKKDYVSLNVLITVLWVTIGYAMLVALAAFGNMEWIMENLSFDKLIIMAGAVIGAYLVLVVVCCILAGSFYHRKHSRAKHRVKQYYRDLSRLGKLYMKEK